MPQTGLAIKGALGLNPKGDISMTEPTTMRLMLEAGVHFGHRTRFWSPKMDPYIYGSRNKIHIINLEKTLPLYREAINFAGKVASKKGVILFVGTKRQASAVIKEQAERCNSPYVNHRWLGGMLTNFQTIKNSITRLVDLEAITDGEQVAKRSKKENLHLEREKSKLNRSLSGIRNMKRLPDAIFIIDVDNERIAVSEAKKLGIPIIGVVDTNSSPDGIDYVIPGNDDAISAIRLYLKGIADAILDSKQLTNKPAQEDQDEYIEIDTTQPEESLTTIDVVTEDPDVGDQGQTESEAIKEDLEVDSKPEYLSKEPK